MVPEGVFYGTNIYRGVCMFSFDYDYYIEQIEDLIERFNEMLDQDDEELYDEINLQIANLEDVAGFLYDQEL